MAKKTKTTKTKRTKPLTNKQKIALAQGHAIMRKAIQIQKESGQTTVTKTKYKMTMANAMKKASGK